MRSTLDVTEASTGTGTITLSCFGYADRPALGTDEIDVLLFGQDTAPYEVLVSVSPRTVLLGGILTVSTVCDPGTDQATVFLASQVLPGDPLSGFLFRQQTRRPGTDGAVQWRLPITGDAAAGFSPPQVGPAEAQVVCGELEPPNPPVRTGFGSAAFTISTAAVTPPRPPAASPGATLADTGADIGRLLALAAAVVSLGAGASLLSRRRAWKASD